MLSRFTFFLPIFNEAHRLKHYRTSLSILKYATIIDAGSTDGSLEILRSWNLSHLHIKSIPNQKSIARSPSWYQKVIEDLQTKYFMIGNAGHVYSISLLQELDLLCCDKTIDYVSIPNYHFFCDRLSSSFGDYHPSKGLSLFISNLLPLWNSSSRQLLHPGIIDWSKYQIHNELPINSNKLMIWKKAKNPIFSFRDEDSYSIELKHAGYSSSHAKDLITLGFSGRVTQPSLLMTYFGHFFHCWIFKASILQGVRGFITAHYWASYHISVKIRLWEIQNKITTASIVLTNNARREQLMRT